MDEFVRRSYMCEVRSEDGNSENERIIVGRPIVYESKTDMGWYDEVICRGALDETDLTDVSFLINHMTSMIPMARSRKDNINSTMQLTVDVNGMAIRAGVDIVNNGTAREFCSDRKSVV